MKVSELIEFLEEQDPDAEVLVMMQQSWPFECSLAGVTTREEMLRADRDEDVDGDEDEEPRLERGTATSDVCPVDADQLRDSRAHRRAHRRDARALGRDHDVRVDHAPALRAQQLHHRTKQARAVGALPAWIAVGE